MPRQYKAASVSTEGKPTEATGVPQPPKTRHSVMDGIVKGVPRGMHTPMPDGIITGLMPKVSGGGLSVAASATKMPEQSFGGGMFQVGKMGR
jgi:hypothetical protein